MWVSLNYNLPNKNSSLQVFPDYKRFKIDSCIVEHGYELSKRDVCNKEFQHLIILFHDILDKHAFIKRII